MPICLVCGAENAKQHYGSWCCNGCKGFFWRSISSKRRYICLNHGSDTECKLEDGRRNCCRACRLKRCLGVGMDPKLIRDCWGKSPVVPQGEMIRDRCQSLGALQSADREKDHQQGTSNADCVFRVEQQNEPLLLKSPCQRQALNVGMDRPKMSQSNLQLLGDYLEWVHSLPELKLLNEDDRNLLVLCRARPSAWLLLAHHQLHNIENRPKIELDKLELLHNEIVGPLRELDSHTIEFELLRNVCFFSTVPQLSEAGRRVVTSVQNAHLRALSEFALSRISLKDKWGEEQPLLLDSVFRLNRMMSVLSAVEKVANFKE